MVETLNPAQSNPTWCAELETAARRCLTHRMAARWPVLQHSVAKFSSVWIHNMYITVDSSACSIYIVCRLLAGRLVSKATGWHVVNCCVYCLNIYELLCQFCSHHTMISVIQQYITRACLVTGRVNCLHVCVTYGYITNRLLGLIVSDSDWFDCRVIHFDKSWDVWFFVCSTPTSRLWRHTFSVTFLTAENLSVGVSFMISFHS